MSKETHNTTSARSTFIRTTVIRLQYKLKELQTLKESLTTLFNKFFDYFDDQVNKTIDSTSSRIKVQTRIGNEQTIDRSYNEINEVIRRNEKKLVLLEKDNGINKEKIAKEISEYVNELKENEYVKESSAIVYEKYETLLNDLIQIIDDLKDEVILKGLKEVDIEELCKYFRETQQKLTDIFKQEGIVHIKQIPTLFIRRSDLDILPQLFIHIPCDVEIDAQLFDSLKKQLVDIIGDDFVLVGIEKGSITVSVMLFGKMAKEVMKNVICGINKLPESVENAVEKLKNYQFSFITKTKETLKVKVDSVDFELSKQKIWDGINKLMEIENQIKEEVFKRERKDTKRVNIMGTEITDSDISVCVELWKNEAIKQEIAIKALIEGDRIEQVKVIKDIDRHEILKLKTIPSIPKSVDNLDNHNETQLENQDEEKKLCDEKINTIINNVEKQKIEEWTQSKIGNIIFDFGKENWKEGISEFNKRILNKSNLIFIIEDDDANKFGGYVNAKICTRKKWINDPKSFVFSLKPNGMMKFDIRESKNAFHLFSRSDDCLFSFGCDDFGIFKENNKNIPCNGQYSFDYKGIENALCGKENFTPKRIIVIQLIKMSQEERIEFEKERINTIANNIQKQKIEEWTGMKIGNIIFDADVDDWSAGTSVLDQILINKSNLIFIIEDEEGNKFGGYINAIIDKCDWICDPKSFLFSLKSNGMMKFDVLDSQNAFYLFSQSSDRLFVFGNGFDISVLKIKMKNESSCYQTSFNYKGIENALCGKRYFTTKKMIVIQLIDLKQQERIEIGKKRSVEDEMKQIEEWSGMKIGNLVFDSNVDNWDVNTSVFHQKIINKSNLIFIIEDESGNKFGGYVNEKIDKVEWIKDPKSFLFSLKSNGRLNGMFKFDILDAKYAFLLDGYSKNDLFSIGSGDVCIYKQSYKKKSSCYQQSFNYNGIKDALCGKTILESPFTPTRITVIQLIPIKQEINHTIRVETIKQEELKKAEEEKLKRILIEKIKKEQQQRKEIEKKRSVEDEMKQIEEWSGMKIGNIIFDSNVDNWDVNTSVFYQKIINKSNLIFIIEDDDGNKFGCYINAKIDKTETHDSTRFEKLIHYVKDIKSFLFSLKSNGRLNGIMKFNILDSQNAFHLDDQSSDRLFLIGGADVCVYKKKLQKKSSCYQLSFNYNGVLNALCGKSQPENFTPKRITVIQLI